MTVNKLQRFAEVSEFSHVLEYSDFRETDKEKPKGRWHRHIFKNSNPIILELACGTGTYTLELARQNPDRNYIGIDIKGARIWKGAKQAKAENLSNIRFLRIFIDHIEEYFAKNEVEEIWITFADPFPRAGDRNKRLTAPKFLIQYKNILGAGHPVHFKTDDQSFYEYTCRSVKRSGGSIVEKVENIYQELPKVEKLTIKTDYERKHLQNGKTISYCKFIFLGSANEMQDDK